MALPPPKSHRITLDTAVQHTKRNPNKGRKGGMFLRKDLDDLLAQPGCSGLRFYYGQAANGADSLILVGVDADGNDMADGVLLDDHFLCPPFCNANSPLNS
jgi:hypothetical protein